MTAEELIAMPNVTWLGRIRILKPKKNEQIGISYRHWHHLAIIGGIVFVYVWDTREIIDAYRLEDLRADFDTIKVSDTGKPIFIGQNSTNRARGFAKMVLHDYADIPLLIADMSIDLHALKEKADAAILDVNIDMFDIMDDTRVVFVDKDIKLLPDMYMFTEAPTVNPAKRKFVDNNAYIGYQKYLAIIGRCALLADWSKHNLQ